MGGLGVPRLPSPGIPRALASLVRAPFVARKGRFHPLAAPLDSRLRGNDGGGHPLRSRCARPRPLICVQFLGEGEVSPLCPADISPAQRGKPVPGPSGFPPARE